MGAGPGMRTAVPVSLLSTAYHLHFLCRRQDFGMNFIRLHQKVNPARWYYAADKLGIMIAQDMIQHYGDGAVRQGGKPAEVCLDLCCA